MNEENIKTQDIEILEQRVAGKSYREIATLLKISPNTVARCVRKHEEVVSSAQHAALEERLRQAGGLKADRIVRTATILSLIESRITKEVIDELTGPQLIDKAAKLNAMLDHQVRNLKFVFERKNEVNKNLQTTEIIKYLDFDM
jgi:DNA-binding Lrp family transcriptional regulator